MLNYVDKNHLQFEGTGEYFLKVGNDSPENLLAYDDFDDTPNYTWTGQDSDTIGGYRHKVIEVKRSHYRKKGQAKVLSDEIIELEYHPEDEDGIRNLKIKKN